MTTCPWRERGGQPGAWADCPTISKMGYSSFQRMLQLQGREGLLVKRKAGKATLCCRQVVTVKLSRPEEALLSDSSYEMLREVTQRVRGWQRRLQAPTVCTAIYLMYMGAEALPLALG